MIKLLIRKSIQLVTIMMIKSL